MTRYGGHHHGQGTMLQQLERVQAANRRPGGVVAAASIAVTLSVAAAALGGLTIVRATEVVQWVLSRPAVLQVLPATSASTEQTLVDRAPFVGVGVLLAALVGIWLAVGVLGRRHAARAGLTAASAATAVVSLPSVLVPVLLPFLVGSLAVLFLIRTNDATRWFEGIRRRR